MGGELCAGERVVAMGVSVIVVRFDSKGGVAGVEARPSYEERPASLPSSRQAEGGPYKCEKVRLEARLLVHITEKYARNRQNLKVMKQTRRNSVFTSNRANEPVIA